MPLWISHTPVFLLKFFGQPPVCATCTAASESCNIKQLQLNIFDKHPGDRAVCAEKFQSDCIKTSPGHWTIIGSHWISKIVKIFWEEVFWGPPKLFFPWMAARLLVSNKYYGCESIGFQGCCRFENRVMKIRHIKFYKSCSSYWYSCFFLNECSLDCYKPLVNFQSSTKVTFEDFCKCFHCLYGEADFGESLFYHSGRTSWKVFLNCQYLSTFSVSNILCHYKDI